MSLIIVKLKIAFKTTKVNPLCIDAPQQLKSDKNELYKNTNLPL